MNTKNFLRNFLQKASNDANLFANQMYNTAIRESILESNKLPFLIFAKVCKHLPSPEYTAYTENILFTNKEQMVDIERNTRGQSRSKLWLEYG